MKAIHTFLVVIENTNCVLYSFTDPKAFPISQHSEIEYEGEWYEVVGKSDWYHDAAEKERAREAESFLRKLKASMPYDVYQKSDIEKQIASVHYYEWQDIYIRKKKAMKVVN